MSPHDVHTVLLIEGDTGNLVETDHVILTDEAALSGCVVTNLATVALPPEINGVGRIAGEVALAGARGPSSTRL